MPATTFFIFLPDSQLPIQIYSLGAYCNVSVNVPPKPTLSSHQTQPIPMTVATISSVAVVVVAAYIGAQMLADIASLKIGMVAGWAVDMGTFVYPITFTLRDVVHKTLGKRLTRTLIITAGVINLFMAPLSNVVGVSTQRPPVGAWGQNLAPFWHPFGASSSPPLWPKSLANYWTRKFITGGLHALPAASSGYAYSSPTVSVSLSTT